MLAIIPAGAEEVSHLPALQHPQGTATRPGCRLAQTWLNSHSRFSKVI